MLRICDIIAYRKLKLVRIMYIYIIDTCLLYSVTVFFANSPLSVSISLSGLFFLNIEFSN